MRLLPSLLKLGLASAVLATSTLASAVTPPPLSDPQNSGGWVINPDATDEFNGNDIDRNVWWIQGENGNWNGQWHGRAPSEYDPDNVRVADGYLYMTARWDESHNFSNGSGGGNSQGSWQYGDVPITTAALLGKHYFHYGYMEMRSKAADGPISSSYWTTGNGGETDAFESYGWNPNNPWSGKRFHTSFHDWRVGSPTYGRRIWENDHIFDFRVADDFHTYGFEWDPNYVAVYIDGAMVNCVTRAEMGDAWVAGNAQRAWIDMETFDWEYNANNLRPEHFNGSDGIDFVVDYARVYQRSGGSSGGTCPDRPNLLQNASFENGMNGWSGDATAITSASHDGNRAASLDGSSTIEQVVAVKPNTTYILSAWANSVNTNQADLWFNAYLGVKDYGNAQADVRYFFPRWHEKSLQFTTGPDTYEATVYFTNDPQGELTYVDEMQLYEAAFTYVGDPVASVSLSPASLTILQRETGRVVAEVLPATAGNKRLLWSSSDESIATVDGVGNIRALAPGVVTITAQSADNLSASDSTQVTVQANLNLLDNGGFEKESLTDWWDSFGLATVTDNPAHVVEGDFAAAVAAGANLAQQFPVEPNTSYRVSAECRLDSPNNTNGVFFIIDGWESGVWGIPMDASTFTSYTEWQQDFTTGPNDDGNMSIAVWNSATVAANGTPSHPQTAYCDNFQVMEVGGEDNGGEVDPVPVTGVTIGSPTNVSLNEGDTVQLSATVFPANADNANVRWSSSNSAIATVSNSGLVTAHSASASAAVITVTTVENGFTDTARITVNQPVASNLVINPGFENGGLGAWPTSYGNSSVVNNNARSGSHAAYLNGNGAVEQDFAVQPNTTYTLSGWVKVGAAGHTAYIGVKNFGGSEVGRLVTSTSYTQQSITFTTGANATTARIYVWNGDAAHRAYADDFVVLGGDTPTDPGTDPSTDPGTDPGTEPGTDPEDPVEPEDCSANWVRVTGVATGASAITMNVGQQMALDYSIFPSCASQPNVTLLSSNWRVVSPNNNGNITARRAGAAVITVRTKDGQFEATTTVTVR